MRRIGHRLFKTMPIYVLCPDNSVKKKKNLGPCARPCTVGTGNLAHTRFGTAAKGGLMSDIMIDDGSRGFLLVKNNQQSDDMYARPRRTPYSVCRSRGSVCGVFQGEFGKLWPKCFTV
jgi:hypothetical protein